MINNILILKCFIKIKSPTLQSRYDSGVLHSCNINVRWQFFLQKM